MTFVFSFLFTAFSPDPCEKAECPSNDCQPLDIHVGYVCYCLPGFQGVDCKDGEKRKVYLYIKRHGKSILILI